MLNFWTVQKNIYFEKKNLNSPPPPIFFFWKLQFWIVQKKKKYIYYYGCKMSIRVLDCTHQIHSSEQKCAHTEFIICPVSSQHCLVLSGLAHEWSVWIFSPCGVKNQISSVWTTADACKVPLIFSFMWRS